MTAIVSDLRTADAVLEAEHWTAPNYHPLPVVIADADGAWVTDVDGRRYLDCLAGYSALNFGHRHPVLIDAARQQLERVTLTSRADFGPYTPGFRIVPYGDLDAMRAAIDDTTVAVLIEPIQGEAGVLVPPAG